MKKPSLKLKLFLTKKQFLMFFRFQGVISCRIKPKKFFFLVFLVEFQLPFTGFLKILCKSSFIEEIFNISIIFNNSQVYPKMWNLLSKCNFLCFWPPEKFVFELMTNLKFSFSENEPGSVYIRPKPLFIFKFSNF